MCCGDLSDQENALVQHEIQLSSALLLVCISGSLQIWYTREFRE